LAFDIEQLRCVHFGASPSREHLSTDVDASSAPAITVTHPPNDLFGRLRQSVCATPLNAVDEARKHAAARALTIRRQRQEHRMARVVVIVITSFLLFWAPFFVLNTVEPSIRDHVNEQTKKGLTTAMKWATVWGYTNSAVNPLIYTFFNQRFRQAITAVVTCRRRSARRTR
jgi:hypothetical protein